MPVHRESRRLSKMHCERKRSVFVKRVSDLGVTEMKRVLFVTSEAVPFIKTGGLADVAGSLPKYFSKNEYEVSVMLPKYMCIREDMRKKMHHILHFYVDLGWRKQYVGILEAKEDGIQYYFIDNEFYFAGDRPYNNIYEDVEKFAFFSKAVLEALPPARSIPVKGKSTEEIQFPDGTLIEMPPSPAARFPETAYYLKFLWESAEKSGTGFEK